MTTSTQSQAPACSHGYAVHAGRHPNGRKCTDGKPAEPLSWEDCAAVADALKAAPGTGEIWRSSYGDIVGEPLSLAQVAVETLTTAGWRRVPAHLLPLLDLTADETAALIGAAAADGRGWSASALRSALDKLTTTEETT